MEKRGEDAPAGVELVVTDKVGLVALQAVEDKRLVCLRDFEVGESSSIGEIQLGNNSLHAETRQLRVHLDIDTLIGLNAHNKLVSGNVLKDTRCDVLELDSNLGLLLIESLSGLHNERYAIPTLVLDVSNECTESRASRVLGDSVVLTVGGLTTVKRLTVLTNDDVLGLNGWNGTENANLLIADILGVERDGPLHSQESKDLEEMVLHDITNDTELVKVAPATLGTKGLLEGDLDVVDVVSVPRGAEERVAKSKNQNVLDHLLAQVVVNSEQFLLVPIRLE